MTKRWTNRRTKIPHPAYYCLAEYNSLYGLIQIGYKCNTFRLQVILTLEIYKSCIVSEMGTIVPYLSSLSVGRGKID